MAEGDKKFNYTQAAANLYQAGGIATGIAGGYLAQVAGEMEGEEYTLQATSLEMQGESARVNAEKIANSLRAKLVRDLGNATATIASRGVSVGSQSAINIRQQITANARRDINDTYTSGKMQQLDYQKRAVQSKGAAAAAVGIGKVEAASAYLDAGLNTVKLIAGLA